MLALLLPLRLAGPLPLREKTPTLADQPPAVRCLMLSELLHGEGRHTNEVGYCFDQLDRQPATCGPLYLRFTIEASGQTSRPQVRAPTHTTTPGECLTTRLARWMFPPLAESQSCVVSTGWHISVRWGIQDD